MKGLEKVKNPTSLSQYFLPFMEPFLNFEFISSVVLKPKPGITKTATWLGTQTPPIFSELVILSHIFGSTHSHSLFLIE